MPKNKCPYYHMCEDPLKDKDCKEDFDPGCGMFSEFQAMEQDRDVQRELEDGLVDDMMERGLWDDPRDKISKAK